MENRERDQVSQGSAPTEAGKLNREVEKNKGRDRNSGTSADFDQSTGRTDDLSEGGNMRNKNDNDLKNTNMGNESTRQPGGGSFGSQSGRSGSVGNTGSSGSDISSDQSSGRKGSRSGSLDDNEGGIGDSSSGRH